MNIKNLRKNNKGYSLVELLISMAIFAMIMIVFTQVMFQALRISYENFSRTQFRESVEEVLDFIQRDIRNSNIIQNCGGDTYPDECTITTVASSVRWQICNDDPNAICKYEIIGGTLDLLKKTSNNVYVENMTFEVLNFSSGNTQFSDSTVIVTIEAVAVTTDEQRAEAAAGRLPLDVQQLVISTRNER